MHLKFCWCILIFAGGDLGQKHWILLVYTSKILLVLHQKIPALENVKLKSIVSLFLDAAMKMKDVA